EDYTIIIPNSFNGGSSAGYARAQSDIELFPNPASRDITIILPSVMDIEHIEVFNIATQSVLQIDGQEGEQVYQFDVRQWLEGMYFIQFRLTDGRRIIKRFIVSANY
ncbi:MAG: hypothetical protein ACI8P3_001644, partial [Saprospiraceae bacterium]